MPIGSIMNTSTLTLTFDDEFNSFVSSPDGSTGLWQTSMANGNRTLGSNGEQEYYSDSSVGYNPFSDQNGILSITAEPTSMTGANALGLPYDSGVITTESSFNQLYGYFEINAELPPARACGRHSGCCRPAAPGRPSSTRSRCSATTRARCISPPIPPCRPPRAPR